MLCCAPGGAACGIASLLPAPCVVASSSELSSLVEPRDWNQTAVFAAEVIAPKKEVAAFSLASMSLGFICSEISPVFCLTNSAFAWVWATAGCSSCPISSKTLFALLTPASAYFATSEDAATVACVAVFANRSVSRANSELARSSLSFEASSLSFEAPSTTLPKPHDHMFFAALTPFCILPMGNAPSSNFCIPAGEPPASD
mmetsp:Transcript_40843/g.91832  ORF Transcript_40843/g.91832 Transcript_40843/m.91832 type:complete len:201 (-) Transcript_40843:140-742(-)